MKNAKKINYELETFYSNYDRQKFWDLFVDYEAWSKSDILAGEITIDKPGKGHPLGEGATRTMSTGSLKIKEDIVGFRPPYYFSYATHDGSLPVNDFGGELFLEERSDGLILKYKGGFNPKFPGTGWLFKHLLRLAQKAAFQSLGKAYDARYNYQP